MPSFAPTVRSRGAFGHPHHCPRLGSAGATDVATDPSPAVLGQPFDLVFTGVGLAAGDSFGVAKSSRPECAPVQYSILSATVDSRNVSVARGIQRDRAAGESRAALQNPDAFLLRTAPRDRQPPTANRHQPPTAANGQPPTATSQPPPTATSQPPTANRRQPPTRERPRERPFLLALRTLLPPPPPHLKDSPGRGERGVVWLMQRLLGSSRLAVPGRQATAWLSPIPKQQSADSRCTPLMVD